MKKAQVPFLHHQLLDFDYSGQEYTLEDHDITLRIPEGAVAEGKKIQLEIAVSMYGPFQFPANTQPISPIIWLCVSGEDVELKKPFQLILPHFFTGLTTERLHYHQIDFAKANHNNYTFEDDQMRYKFNKCDTKPLFASNGGKSYGILRSTHCCFYCLQANQTSELARDAGYCLARIEHLVLPLRNEVYFTAIYLLNTCMKVLEVQTQYKS